MATIEGGFVSVEVMVFWTCTDGSPFGSAHFVLGGEEPTCILETLEIDEDHQQRGFATKFTRALVELCRDLRLKSVLVFANKVGRYTWARLGFQFADQEQRTMVIDAAKDFATKLSAELGVEVPIDLDTEVEHPDHIARLGGEIAHEDFARLRNDDEPLSPERPMTLGMALLLGPANNPWYGELSLISTASKDVESTH